MNRTPPIGSSKIAIDQAWIRMVKKVSTDFSETGWSNFLFVDGEIGNNDTAKRGSLTYKYKTIQAALNAAQNNDTVWVGTGTFVENLVWPNATIALRGMGKNETIVQTVGVPLTLAPTGVNVIPRARISDIALWSTDGSDALVVDGTSDPDNFDSLDLSEVFVAAGNISISTANRVNMNGVRSEGGLILLNSGTVMLFTCDLKSVSVDYEVAPAFAPTIGNNGLVAFSTTCTSLTVIDFGRAMFGKDTQVGEIETTLIGTLTSFGFVWCSGKVPGNVNINFSLTNEPREVARLDFAEIGGLITTADWGGGGGTEVGTVNCKNAILYDTTEDGHVAGDLSVLDLRGAQFSQTAVTATGTGAIDRTNWYITELAGGFAPARVIAITPPYPTGKTDYTVLCDLKAHDDGPVGVSVKAVNQFTRTKTLDGGDVRYQLIRPYD